MAKSRHANAKTVSSSPAVHRKNLSVDLAQRNEREKRYMSVIKKYEPSEVHRFPQMLAELTMAMEYGPDDVLGQVFGELELGNSSRGQFFTPYPVCQIMAAQRIGDGKDLHERLQERGFITVAEPACGAGAMPIAFAEALTSKGVNFQRALHVVAQDLDSRAVHMTYLQLSILHIPAIIILGNTLLMEKREQWYTPAHILGGWNYKLSNTKKLTIEQADSVNISVERINTLPTTKQMNGQQFALF